jgi:glutathione S-transferase
LRNGRAADPDRRLSVRRLSRCVELQIPRTFFDIVEHTVSIFAQKLEQIPALAEAQRKSAPRKWAWLDKELSDSCAYVAGDRFTVADITGMAALVVSDFLKIEVTEDFPHLQRWSEKVRARPSWSA